MTYSTKHVARLTGLSFRQIDYWHRAGSITPTVDSDGSGTRREWSVDDLGRLHVIASISDLYPQRTPTTLVAVLWALPWPWPSKRLHIWRQHDNWVASAVPPGRCHLVIDRAPTAVR